MSRRRGSATALKLSEVVAARDMSQLGPDATPGVYLLQLGTSERHLVLPGATSPSQR